MNQIRYLDYEASRDIANIVVDGSPNEGTVLALSHWPGTSSPSTLWADLSAQMAFLYLDQGPDHDRADVVTNNHFDQDGLVAIHALVHPEQSLEHRDLLIDVAAAGDFGTYRDRRAARASMAISRFVEREIDCKYDEFTDQLYTETLPLLMSMVLDGNRFRDLWAEEDEALNESEALIASGSVEIEEHLDLDLGVVTIPPQQAPLSGHRFGAMSFEGLHPMAINNATGALRLLVVHGRRYQYTDRYETWVQYRSRRPLPRIDLRDVAEQLTESETSNVTWSADEPGSLTPQLGHDDESSLSVDRVVVILRNALTTLPSAWNPYETVGGS